jgi:hypothetical protein
MTNDESMTKAQMTNDETRCATMREFFRHFLIRHSNLPALSLPNGIRHSLFVIRHSERRFFAQQTLLRAFLVIAIAGLTSGCAIAALFARAMPQPKVQAAYKGLQKQRVAVMVWTDRAMAIDWPTLKLDLSRGLQSRLQEQAQPKDHPKELEGTTFAAPESVIRFQRDHPEIETQLITDVAPRMDIDRLIYLEVEQFHTRPEQSLELFRGSITVNLKVVENADGKAKVTFQQDNIHVVYPSTGPEEGTPGLNDADVYEQTLTALATQVVNHFVPHPPDEDAK